MFERKTVDYNYITIRSTPQQYNKKTVKIGQGLDFLKFWGGKSRETTGKNNEKPRKYDKKLGISGPYFLIRNFLTLTWK